MTSATDTYQQRKRSPHGIHIPVMGTGFTVDTPLRMAKYGLSSVISLLDDVLIEQMRKHHAQLAGEPYTPITEADEDCRAHRITAYLDLVGHLVEKQVALMKTVPFNKGSDICRYFELLPDCPERDAYLDMLATDDLVERLRKQDGLRELVVPGSIDVNIMTKSDRETYRDGQKLPPEHCFGMSALRGFALSSLRSAIVFSAGLNQRLYAYCAQFSDFLPGPDSPPKKEIILKVSDYRSALIQGKFFAKHGLWIAEYRVESGLNCGGHAFAAQGQLLGPVLEEFKTKKAELLSTLRDMYVKALRDKDIDVKPAALAFRITAQGGITTHEEHENLIEMYGIDGTGWGTPFLLVPEVTNVDAKHLRKLARAKKRDVWLSNSSPLGIPFWNLRNSDSEISRRRRIHRRYPGSSCFKGYGAFCYELGDMPVCLASRTYQRLKLAELKSQKLGKAEYRAKRNAVLDKSCICHDLAGSATLKLEIDHRASPAICCGPSIAKFNRVYTLEEMLGHIYGRINLLAGQRTPHMFTQELKLSVAVLKQETYRLSRGFSSSTPKRLQQTRENLQSHIAYYEELCRGAVSRQSTQASRELAQLNRKLQRIPLGKAIARYLNIAKKAQALR
jgi:hypothetical protein